jgi:hypothetical protein
VLLVLLGFVLGVSVALVLVVTSDSSHAAENALRPFGLVGFVLGNVHQGSTLVSISAACAAFGVAGATVGLVLSMFWRS